MRASNFGERQLAGLDLRRLRTILVATDLTAPEDAGVQRAAQLAQVHQAVLRIMALPPRGLALPVDAAQRLAEAARALALAHGLRVAAVPVRCHTLDDLVAQAAGADLVVLPHRSARTTAAFFRGRPVLRVLRGAGCPVLVARHPGGAPYQRVLVGVDFAPESQALVKFAAHLDPQASVQLLHAVSAEDEARLRAADVLEDAVLAYRERSVNDAWGRMFALTDACDLRPLPVTALGHGEPGGQLVKQQQSAQADLVVVGKKPGAAWSDLLCGSVAHRVLSWSTGDVLVVPLRREHRARRVVARLPSDLDVLRTRRALESRHERA